MVIGTDSIYSFTFEHQKRKECPVCGGDSITVEFRKEWTVERLIEVLVERQDMYVPSPFSPTFPLLFSSIIFLLSFLSLSSLSSNTWPL